MDSFGAGEEVDLYGMCLFYSSTLILLDQLR